MVPPARLPEVQPAPQPQSTDREPGIYGGYRQVYTPPSHIELVAANSDGMTSDATYDSVETPPSNPDSPLTYYANGIDCPRSLPIQHSIHPLRINGTPPASNDGVVTSSQESTSSINSSPPRRAAGRRSLGVRTTTRVARAPRSRRRTRNDKEPVPDISDPLSELTKHMINVPIRDMEAEIHRPIMQRRAEVAQRNGRVKRPMNSFMIYRSAYAPRTKEFLHLRNHQEVSRLLGKSWGMETPDIRTKYEELANIEKDNHALAHPDYKFAPRKDPNPRGRRQDTDEVSLADADDEDFASEPIQPTFRFSGESEIESNFDSRESTPFDNPIHGLPTSGSIFTWQATNTSQPDAGMMLAGGQQYLQTSLRPVPTGAHVEDLCVRTSYPDVPYTTSSELAGLPGASHYELVQPQTPSAGNADGQLDPRLLMHGSDSPVPVGAIPYQHSNYPVWQEPQGSSSYLPVPSSVAQSPASYLMALGPYHAFTQALTEHGSFDSSRETGLDGPDSVLEPGWTFVPRTIEDDLTSRDGEGYKM